MSMNRLALLALGGLMSAGQSGGQRVPNEGPVFHFVNGQWFDGSRFVKADFYSEGGILTHHPDERRGYQTVDLHGGFVVPPYGDAHEHNFDGVANTKAVSANYLRDGIFYAQGMTNNPSGAAEVIAAVLVDTRTTPDVTYAQGALTAVNGHPKEVYESLANGFYYPQTPEQRKLVIEGNKREGKAFWQIADAAMLDAKWPAILAGKPDLIKIILSESEHFKQATADDPQLGKGIDPVLVPLITAKAHAAGLKVVAHIDTAADFHVAVTGGVDEMGHMPGYYIHASDDLAVFRLADADIELAAKRHVTVQATAGIDVDEHTAAADLKARQASQIDNLRRLKKAGVVIFVGSDHYGQDSVHEADYLQGLGLWSNLEMLRMWAVATPEDVFPKRRIGELKEGYEASFLVLGGDPLKDWGVAHKITDRWKQGEHVVVAAP
jgi:hypothetical protein